MEKEGYKKVLVKTWYLKHRGSEISKVGDFDVVQWLMPDVVEYLKLFKAVGEKWGWAGRLLMKENELQSVLHSSVNEVWFFRVKGEIKGFFEIDLSVVGKAEIVYLGLLPTEIGKGHGKQFLEAAIACAGKDKRAVWLHTCEYDHPKALSIYLKAGFTIESESVEEECYSDNFLLNELSINTPEE